MTRRQNCFTFGSIQFTCEGTSWEFYAKVADLSAITSSRWRSMRIATWRDDEDFWTRLRLTVMPTAYVTLGAPIFFFFFFVFSFADFQLVILNHFVRNVIIYKFVLSLIKINFFYFTLTESRASFIAATNFQLYVNFVFFFLYLLPRYNCVYKHLLYLLFSFTSPP